MNDKMIRAALLEHLSSDNYSKNSIVVSEMGLSEGKAIIDIAHINGMMWGYEIKSDVDSLYRLRAQIETYQKFFHHLTVVTTKTHLSKVRKNYPKWIGIMLAYQSEGVVLIKQLRQASRNNRISKSEITTLFWRDEAKSLLTSRGVKGISSAPRQILWSKMAEMCSEEELIDLVQQTMGSRKAWQVVASQTQGADYCQPSSRP